jgi:hypothetical protein
MERDKNKINMRFGLSGGGLEVKISRILFDAPNHVIGGSMDGFHPN